MKFKAPFFVLEPQTGCMMRRSG